MHGMNAEVLQNRSELGRSHTISSVESGPSLAENGPIPGELVHARPNLGQFWPASGVAILLGAIATDSGTSAKVWASFGGATLLGIRAWRRSASESCFFGRQRAPPATFDIAEPNLGVNGTSGSSPKYNQNGSGSWLPRRSQLPPPAALEASVASGETSATVGAPGTLPSSPMSGGKSSSKSPGSTSAITKDTGARATRYGLGQNGSGPWTSIGRTSESGGLRVGGVRSPCSENQRSGGNFAHDRATKQNTFSSVSGVLSGFCLPCALSQLCPKR